MRDILAVNVREFKRFFAVFKLSAQRFERYRVLFRRFVELRSENDISFNVAAKVFFRTDDISFRVHAPAFERVFSHAIHVAAYGVGDFLCRNDFFKRFSEVISLDDSVVIFVSVIAHAYESERRHNGFICENGSVGFVFHERDSQAVRIFVADGVFPAVERVIRFAFVVEIIVKRGQRIERRFVIYVHSERPGFAVRYVNFFAVFAGFVFNALREGLKLVVDDEFCREFAESIRRREIDGYVFCGHKSGIGNG